MNRELAMKIANAVLYEGYMLYPYRPSAIKNRQRWSFGILYPPAYHEVAAGTERSAMHSECLVKITEEARLHIQLRFLHLGIIETAEGGDESSERSVELEIPFHRKWMSTPQELPYHFASALAKHEACGTISVAVTLIQEDVLKLTINVSNTSTLAGDPHDREAALLTSLLSAHTLLSVTSGEFVSLLDPPDDLRDAANHCQNIGNFPVLVGAQGERDMMLCSPIVLYDYPQIAPESAGEFFDSTEMDEMLTLRVMTLTDEEKEQMRAASNRTRELLQRTEAGAREQLMRTHGTIRSLRPVSEP